MVIRKEAHTTLGGPTLLSALCPQRQARRRLGILGRSCCRSSCGELHTSKLSPKQLDLSCSGSSPRPLHRSADQTNVPPGLAGDARRGSSPCDHSCCLTSSSLLPAPRDSTLGPELASASPAAPGHHQQWPPLTHAPSAFSLRDSFISQSR